MVVQVAPQLERELAEVMGEEDDDSDEGGDTADLSTLDLTPKKILLEYIGKSYPTQAYEPVTDDEGNTSWEPVYRKEWDENGKVTLIPVEDPVAVEAKMALMREIALMDAPMNALDQIMRHFGVENIAGGGRCLPDPVRGQGGRRPQHA